MMNKVQTKYGMVQGAENRNYTVFKGIPYAKASIGSLRFRYPVETKAWDGIYLADKFPPAADSDAMLPVAVWLYGGACICGYCAEKEFDGAEYAARGVILVTFNYRLGLFGFMCHPLLAEENNGSCGNYGIFDQIAALKWVKENIKAFGKDPDNITLFGQSAGSLTAQTLLLSPLTKGLFNKCIFQSGAGLEEWKPWTRESQSVMIF